MNIEIVIAFISIGVAISNSVAVAGMYWRYIQDARNVFYMLRADENGEVEISDPFDLIK